MIKLMQFPADSFADLKKALGRRVVSRNNKVIGSVSTFYIDPEKHTIAAIRVKSSKLLADIIEGEHIDKINKIGVTLKNSPITNYKGVEVIDLTGKTVGFVKSLKKTPKTKKIKKIIISRGKKQPDLILEKKFVTRVTDKIYLNLEI